MSTSTYSPPPSGPRFGPGKWINREGGLVMLTPEWFDEYHNQEGKCFIDMDNHPALDLIQPADDETAARYGWTKEE